MKRLLIIAVAFVLSMTLAMPVFADEVDTEAVVGGSGSSPYVCAKFETPDDDPLTSNTQISPIPGEKKTVKFYVTVGDTNGVDDVAAVYIKVYELDGTTLKFQLDAIKPHWTIIPWTGLVDMDGDCTGDTSVPDALDALDAQGRITYGFDPVRGVTMDLGLLKYDLENGKQVLVELVGEMDYHQPAGAYMVEAIVVDQSGKTGTLTNFFDYLSIVALRIDFTKINWGTVNVSKWNVLYGDSDMSTPAKPTIQNIGNDPAKIELHATDMLGAIFGKKITLFDADMLGGHIEFNSCIPTVITDDTGAAVELPPCTPTQIDFSVHPPDGTPEDTYTGKMTITILHYADP
jgi:hypothetical protein